MFNCLQTLPLSQAGARRPDPEAASDAVFEDLLLVDSAVPAPMIIRSLRRMSGIDKFHDIVNLRPRNRSQSLARAA